MTLQQWIKKNGGPTRVSEILNVNRVSVHQWNAHLNLPRDEIKHLIVRLTKGQVSYAGIIEPYLKARGKMVRG